MQNNISSFFFFSYVCLTEFSINRWLYNVLFLIRNIYKLPDQVLRRLIAIIYDIVYKIILYHLTSFDIQIKNSVWLNLTHIKSCTHKKSISQKTIFQKKIKNIQIHTKCNLFLFFLEWNFLDCGQNELSLNWETLTHSWYGSDLMKQSFLKQVCFSNLVTIQCKKKYYSSIIFWQDLHVPYFRHTLWIKCSKTVHVDGS